MFDLIIVDLDHTIRRPLNGATFAETPEDQEPINQYIYEENKGAKFFGYSNQAGIQMGYKTHSDTVRECIITMDQQPHLDGIAFCPDFDGDELCIVLRGGLAYSIFSEDGGYRKPDSKGILEIIEGIYNIPLDKVKMYGDRMEDETAAKAVNIEFEYV